MPSAEETTYLFEVMPEVTQEFTTRDVDLLVSQIKENLRLSGFKAKSALSRKNRPSPYCVPSRSWAEPGNCEVCGTRSNTNGDAPDQRHLGHYQHHHHHHHHRHHHHHHYHHIHSHKRNTTREHDPYELLQELLREGGLIKEAVKRLQTDLDDLDNSEEEIVDEEDDESDDVADEVDEKRQRRRDVQQQRRVNAGYRRKPYFYDSEDEPLPSVYEPLEL